MQQKINRVRDAQEIHTMPDYVALSQALQNDMLQAAQHIRNALYDNPHMETLAIALIALDFPHFIPIENTIEALEQELERLDDEWWETVPDYWSDELDFIKLTSITDQLDDLKAEIERRKVDPCKNHFSGGWYVNTANKRRFAVPPHMGVDAEHACSHCRGWLSYPSDFLKWDGE